MFNSIMKIKIALLIWIHDIQRYYIIYHVFFYMLSLSFLRWRCNFSALIWLRFCWVSWYCCICFSWHSAWTPVKPQWRLFKAFGGGRRRIQSNLVRIQLDLSFRVVFSRICGVSSRIGGVSSQIWGVSSWVRGVSSRIGVVSSWVWGSNFNRGVGHFQWWCQKSNGGIEKGQWGHWKNQAGVLCRVSGGHWGHGERVNGGIEKGQWGIGQG